MSGLASGRHRDQPRAVRVGMLSWAAVLCPVCCQAWAAQRRLRQHRAQYKSAACSSLKNSLTDNDLKGMFKVVVDAKTDKVLGIHLVGPEVAEILQVGPWLLHVLGTCCEYFIGSRRSAPGQSGAARFCRWSLAAACCLGSECACISIG